MDNPPHHHRRGASQMAPAPSSTATTRLGSVGMGRAHPSAGAGRSRQGAQTRTQGPTWKLAGLAGKQEAHDGHDE